METIKREILLLVISFASFSAFSQGGKEEGRKQHVKFGLHAGINIANQAMTNLGDTHPPLTSVTRFNAGIFSEIPFTSNFAGQTEINYSGMGFQQNVTGTHGEDLLYYLSVPVIIKYKFLLKGFAIYAGPQYSYLVSAKVKYEFSFPPSEKKNDIKSFYKSSELAGITGVEYFFPNGFGISASYQRGFSNIFDVPGDITVRNHAFIFKIGYCFD